MSIKNRDPEECKNAIRDQFIFIKNSCDLFDTGCKPEGLRIAAALSVLLEVRREGKGLLRSIPDVNFKILSVVPDVLEVELDKLILSKLEKQSELANEINNHKDEVKLNNKILLIYVVEGELFHLFAINGRGEEISCSVADLKTIKKGCKPIIEGCITGCIRDNNWNISDIQKKIIIEHLSFLLDHNIKYISGTYLPLVENIYLVELQKLEASNFQELDIDLWLQQPIFCMSDEARKNHILTRDKLIFTARDKDGGGHFDPTLKDLSYSKSKYGEILALKEGDEEEDITTEGFHLEMLRQLGYEILNSPSINEYIKP
jgi:hypothetical protein